jgi:hypothetical protein
LRFSSTLVPLIRPSLLQAIYTPTKSTLGFKKSRDMSSRSASAPDMSATSLCALLEQYNLGPPFTCFTGTNVQMLTQKALVGAHLSADFAGSTGLADVLHLDLSNSESPQVFFHFIFFIFL